MPIPLNAPAVWLPNPLTLHPLPFLRSPHIVVNFTRCANMIHVVMAVRLYPLPFGGNLNDLGQQEKIYGAESESTEFTWEKMKKGDLGVIPLSDHHWRCWQMRSLSSNSLFSHCTATFWCFSSVTTIFHHYSCCSSISENTLCSARPKKTHV